MWRTRKMTGCIRDFALGDFDMDLAADVDAAARDSRKT